MSALVLGFVGLVGCGDDPKPVVTTNFDLSSGSLTVAEGQSVTFTVALTQAPSIDAAVQLAVADGSAATISPQVVTFSAGDTSPKTITITGVEDNDLTDESTTISVSAPGIAAGSIDLTVTDNDAQAIVVGSTAVTLTEGATGTVGVHLAYQPSADTAVAISSADAARLGVNPATLTFTSANYGTDQTLTLSAAEDADTAQNTVDATLSASGLTPVTVTATINDNDTQGVTTSVAMLALTEGGADGTFQVTLNSQPSSTVVLDVVSSDGGAAFVTPTTLTFTAADYDQGTAHIVNVHPADDNDTANETATITISGNGLSATVPVTVADDDTQAIVTNPATTVNVGEGGTTTMGVRLAFDPGAQISVTVGSSDAMIAGVTPTTLTFDSDNYSSEQQVTISGAQDADLADDSTSVMLTSTGISTKSVTVNVADDDTQAIVLSGVSAGNNLTLTEGTSANVGVRLAFQPASTVTVTIGSGDETLLTSTPTSLQFTTADWNTPKMIALSALDENNLVNDTVAVTLSDGGATSASLDVTILDNDVQGFFVMPATLPDIDEGGDTTFTVRLNVPPAAPVVATITSSNSKFKLNGGASTQVTIPTGNTAQSVTVHLDPDADAADETATISIADQGAVVPTIALPVTGLDDDDINFVVTPTTTDASRLEVVEESATVATFKVHLSAAPTAPTTVTVTPSATNTIELSNNGTGFTATTTLAFDAGNYMTDQTVTIRGLSDPNLVDELLTVTVGGAPLGAPDASVFVRKIEDDAQAIVTNPAQPGPLAITEGSSKPLAVSLQYQPTQSVQVTVTPNHADGDILVNGTTAPVVLLFTTTNYATPQIVTVTTPDDQDQIDPNGGTITVSSPALATRTINVGLTDDDDQSIVLSAPSASIVERDGTNNLGQANFTVKLAFIPTASPETITLTIPEGKADKLDFVDPSTNEIIGDAITLEFDGTSYATAQPVRVQAEDDNDVGDEDVVIGLTSDRAPLLGQDPAATFSVHISDDDVLSLVFDDGMAQDLDEPDGDLIPIDPKATTHTWKVKLNHIPTANVVVTFTSSDPDAAKVSSGASLTFTAANWETEQDVVVDTVADADVHNEVVTVTAASPGTDPNDPADVALKVNVRDLDQQELVASGTINVTENGSATLNVHLDQEPAADVVVALSYTNDAIEGLASGQTITLNGAATTSLTFTQANYGTDQAVTVASPDDADLDHFTGKIHLVLSSAQVGQEAPAAEDYAFAVRDDDTQSIVVTSEPIVLVDSAQEGGPAVMFKVKLSHRPRLGLTDTVELVGPGNVRFLSNGSDTLDVAFDGTDWNTDVEVWWYAHEYGTNDNFTGSITLKTLEEDAPAGDQVPPFGDEDLNASAEHVVRVLDDDTQQVVNTSNYLADGFNGATNFTQRSNIAFAPDGTAEGRVAITARSATEGGTGVLGFSTRALAPLAAGPQFATAGTEPTTEIVLPDPAGFWDVFASSSEGIVYNRYTLVGAQVGSQIVIAPAASNATDFSVARIGDTYGVIYRRQETSRNNLYFRTLDVAMGTVSNENVSTTADSLVHFHPTLLATAGTQYDPGSGLQSTPWAVLYSSNSHLILARLGATGTQVGSYDFTTNNGIPGTFASALSVNGYGIVATNVNNTMYPDGENHVWIYGISVLASGQAAEVVGTEVLTMEPFTPVSPPSIASNVAIDSELGDIAVAYDSSLGGVYTVGVALFNFNSGPRDYRLDTNTDDEGVYPSITWALDRWVLRYQATSPTSPGIRLRSGSFEGESSGGVARQLFRKPVMSSTFSSTRILK